MLGFKLGPNKSKQIAIAITDAPKGTGYLGFRDLPNILDKHVSGNKVLDVGCGSGRSTRYLRAWGYDVVGIDICPKMIKQAKEKDVAGDYRQIENESWPINDEKYDLITFSFVLLELPTKDDIVKILEKAKSALKDNGVIVISTTSEEAYQNDWISMKTDFEQNKNPISGQQMKIYLKDYGFEVKDYFWSDSDYRNCLERADLSLLKQYKPLGKESDGKPWTTEKELAPFSIYVAGKKPR